MIIVGQTNAQWKREFWLVPHQWSVFRNTDRAKKDCSRVSFGVWLFQIVLQKKRVSLLLDLSFYFQVWHTILVKLEGKQAD